MRVKIAETLRRLERGKISKLMPSSRKPHRRPALDISSQPAKTREAINTVRGVIQDGWDSKCDNCRRNFPISDVKKDFLEWREGLTV